MDGSSQKFATLSGMCHAIFFFSCSLGPKTLHNAEFWAPPHLFSEVTDAPNTRRKLLTALRESYCLNPPRRLLTNARSLLRCRSLTSSGRMMRNGLILQPNFCYFGNFPSLLFIQNLLRKCAPNCYWCKTFLFFASCCIFKFPFHFLLYLQIPLLEGQTACLSIHILPRT